MSVSPEEYRNVVILEGRLHEFFPISVQMLGSTERIHVLKSGFGGCLNEYVLRDGGPRILRCLSCVRVSPDT